MSNLGDLNLSKDVADFKKRFTKDISKVKSDSLTPVDATMKKLGEGVSLISNKDTEFLNTVKEYKNNVVDEIDGIVSRVKAKEISKKLVSLGITVGENGLSVDKDKLMGEIGQKIGATKMGLSVSSFADNISSEVERLSKNGIGGLVTKDHVLMLTSVDWKNLNGKMVLRSITDMLGGEEFKDFLADVALLNATFKSALDFGLKERYKDLFNSYPDDPLYHGARRDNVVECFGLLLRRGDMEGMFLIAEELDLETRNIILARYPNYLRELFRNYKFGPQDFPENYHLRLGTLKGLLGLMFGEEEWWYKHTEFGKALDLTIITGVDGDMKVLLSLWDEVAPLVCCTGMFREEPSMHEFFKQFPHTPIVDKHLPAIKRGLR